MADTDTPGGRVRGLRLDGGLGYEALSQKSGVAVWTIKLLERRPERNPQVRTLAKLAEALGTTVTYLVDGTAPSTDPQQKSA